MHKLFVKVGNKYRELSAYGIPDKITARRVQIDFAIETYINVCTSTKAKSSQGSEKLYFYRLMDFLSLKNIEIMGDIETLHMEEFQSHLLVLMKVSSVNRRFNTIKHFFEKCEEWGFISKNPCKRMKKKREENNSYKPWPRVVYKRFIANIDGVYLYLFKFLWLTGCRPMEAKNLRWTDIDYDRKVLILRCGKNANISREFPISKHLSNLLHTIPLDSLYVFTKDQKQINNDSLYHFCKKRLKRIKQTQYTVYGLRHSFGARVPGKGADAFQLQYLLGHSKMETTKRYRNLDHSDLLKILDKVK